MNFREGTIQDLDQLKQLAIKAWSPYQAALTRENWEQLYNSLNKDITYIELLHSSYCLVCENSNKDFIGMAFLVPQGNPTAIYPSEWSYIRFVSVDPAYSGKGIGRELTSRCITRARQMNEKVIALHTSEMMLSARHIYESLGFAIVREIDNRFGKRYWLYKMEL